MANEIDETKMYEFLNEEKGFPVHIIRKNEDGSIKKIYVAYVTAEDKISSLMPLLKPKSEITLSWKQYYHMPISEVPLNKTFGEIWASNRENFAFFTFWMTLSAEEQEKLECKDSHLQILYGKSSEIKTFSVNEYFPGIIVNKDTTLGELIDVYVFAGEGMPEGLTTEVSTIDESEDISLEMPVSQIKHLSFCRALEQEDLEQGDIEVVVRSLTGSVVTLKINREDNVGLLMEKHVLRTGIPWGCGCRFVFGGKALEAHRTIEEYNITDGSTISFILSLRGN